MFFKNKKKNHPEDLNHKVSEYQKWWKDQTQELAPSRPNFKKDQTSPWSRRACDDSFVYYEGN